MAKEIFLIGIGPEGRHSLLAPTVDLLQGCHLIIGGKRVISQFEDLGVPTYTMSSNLRQLVEVINGAEAAVAEGRDVQEAFARRASAGEGDGDDDEPSDGDDGNGGDEERVRRRGRRRPSPRSRGRSRRGASAEAPEAGNAPGGSGTQDEGGAEAAQGAVAEGGAVPETSVLEAEDRSVPFAVEVNEAGSGTRDFDAGESGEEEGAEGGVAVEEPPAAEDETSTGDEDSGDETAEPREKGRRSDSGPVARIAVLASGDPNFFGLSKFLLDRFKKEEISIVPHVSAMQLAFAAIKEPMNDAVITSSSGRNVDRLLRLVRQNAKIGIFTDKRRSPRAVAKLLAKHSVDARCYVCQDLGTPRERIIMGSLEEIASKNFSPLSIMVLFKSPEDIQEPAPAAPSGGRGGRGERSEERKRNRSDLKEIPPPGKAPKYDLVTSLGVPDEMLAARPEKMMRSEMRVIVLAKLQMKVDSKVWDVGAGAGALSVEAARVAHGGEVFAIERDFAQIRNIYENIKEFGLSNVTVIEGDIEEMAAGLPVPDRIFIGGCGGRMSEVMGICLKRLKPGGILSVNAATLDALTEIQHLLKEQRLQHEMVIVNLSKTVERQGLEYFEGFNPGYLITTRKD
jgi:precorrin-6Y C5,15-methyltransferase (decarboxylating)